MNTCTDLLDLVVLVVRVTLLSAELSSTDIKIYSKRYRAHESVKFTRAHARLASKCKQCSLRVLAIALVGDASDSYKSCLPGRVQHYAKQNLRWNMRWLRDNQLPMFAAAAARATCTASSPFRAAIERGYAADTKF